MSIENFLTGIGITINNYETLQLVSLVIKLIIAFFISWICFFVARTWLSELIFHIISRTKNSWDDVLYEQKFFRKVMHILPPIIFNIAIFSIEWEYIWVVQRIVTIWIVIAFLFVTNTFLNAVNTIYEGYQISKNRPIKAIIQITKIALYTVAFIIIISIIVNKSPEKLLTGLAAFTAVLILVFKDSILGFIAGVQLVANGLVKIGDWIVMPDSSADGEVIDISLHTVKIQNWDKTIASIPTYKLFSEPFTNWRGMTESDGRRIKRSIFIDISSIHFLSEKEIESLKNSSFLNKYINHMTTILDGYEENNNNNHLDVQRLTNIGVFRKYLDSWINANSDVNQSMTHMVRQLQPTPNGVPIEIYCFSKKQDWTDYENVQSDLFDHVLAVVPYFNLKIYQYSNIVPK